MEYFIATLVSMYNLALTTLQGIVALNQETGTSDSTSQYVKPHIYLLGITDSSFNSKIFWRWTLNALLHGTLVYFVCAYSYGQAIVAEATIFSFKQQSTLAFALIVQIVNYKLYLELN